MRLPANAVTSVQAAIASANQGIAAGIKGARAGSARVPAGKLASESVAEAGAVAVARADLVLVRASCGALGGRGRGRGADGSALLAALALGDVGLLVGAALGVGATNEAAVRESLNLGAGRAALAIRGDQLLVGAALLDGKARGGRAVALRAALALGNEGNRARHAAATNEAAVRESLNLGADWAALALRDDQLLVGAAALDRKARDGRAVRRGNGGGRSAGSESEGSEDGEETHGERRKGGRVGMREQQGARRAYIGVWSWDRRTAAACLHGGGTRIWTLPARLFSPENQTNKLNAVLAFGWPITLLTAIIFLTAGRQR
jgi:hypothetical protein